jgi:fatty-acyl-CoA synthase
MVTTMLAYDRGPTTPPLLDETIGANLERIAAQWPEQDALVDVAQDIRLPYCEFNAAVDCLAHSFLALGIDAGDRVGIWAPNCTEWVLVQYATAKIGIILVTINPAYRTSELEYALGRSGCRMLVAAETFKGSDYRAMVTQVAPSLPALEHVVYLHSTEWDEFVAAGIGVGNDAVRERARGIDPHDPVNIQYTSGTTGFPKGVTLSHFNILNNAYQVGERCGYQEADRVCIPVPLYHCFGMVLGCLAATTHGAAIILPGPAYEAEAVLRAVERERCTSLYGVPTMFIDLLERAGDLDVDVASLRTGIMAGAPCPADVMDRVMTDLSMPQVTICYGMTETSPVSTQTLPHDNVSHRVSTIGTVHPHVELKIVDPDTGSTLDRKEIGEICTRGYLVMQGYWEDPENTAQVIDAEGWMHSGDLGMMTEDGYVTVEGRIKDMVIRGGENLYPREIEEFLMTHPDVINAQVVGVPDARMGEELLAWILVRPEVALDEDTIRAYCRDRIAHFKVPRYFAFVDTFPMTVTGKVQKYKLREMGLEELGLRQAPTTRTR